MIIYCDGGSRGNPGPAASAFVATEGDKVLYKEAKYLGRETNNFAEYTAVLLATTWLVQQFSNYNFQFPIIINLDSQLVQRQLTGIYKIKNINLKNIAESILKLVGKNNLDINFVWNYREKNSLADSLVNEELDNFLQREKLNTSTGK